MANQTMQRFGYPDTLIKEYAHWAVVLREQQVTLGSLVLCAKSDATAFSDVPAGAFAELHSAVSDIERALAAAFSYDKINYLMLMMVDPHVHFHVVPRYAKTREFGGVSFADAGWPGVPDLGATAQLDQQQFSSLVDFLKGRWPAR